MDGSGAEISKEMDIRMTRYVIEKRVSQIIGVCKAILFIRHQKRHWQRVVDR